MGAPAYDSLLLFKISLLQIWYDLGDKKAEKMVCQFMPFRYFCGLSMVDKVPDHTVIGRFRNTLINAKIDKALLDELNKQCSQHHISIKEGKAAVDASITVTERKPSGQPKYDISNESAQAEQDHLKDRTKTSQAKFSKNNKQPTKTQVKKLQGQNVDQEANWTKKQGRWQYGYKRHYLTDTETNLVKSVTTTAAHVHDSKALERLLHQANLPPGTAIYADKAYCGDPVADILKQFKLKNRIQDKGYVNQPLGFWQRRRNWLLSKTRCHIERVFGSIKKWFRGGVCRYVGLAKTHWQHTMEAIAYNLKIIPGLVKLNKIFMG